MADLFSDCEVVIGLEVHAELNTKTKMFCGCSAAFGAAPNTQCCEVCGGFFGGVPRLNRRGVEKAVTAGLALHCEIAEVCRMDRKQYFYPDLPKAYQISQNEHPLCRNGFLEITVGGEKKRIGITRIHMEEDAGKLIHEGGETLLDLNRSGVGLIEIVSEPDLRSAEEAVAYLKELREILLACDVSDCRMQEGSFRCDVNLSIRPVGSEAMGTRTEIKNLNSFSHAEKAIGAEILRQKRELAEHGFVRQRTVRFLQDSGRTEPMRDKESAADYRFFPEPKLPPIRISRHEVEALRKRLPELPSDKRERLCRHYGIPAADAAILVSVVGASEYYEAAVGEGSASVQVCNLLIQDLLPLCDGEAFCPPLSPKRLGELGALLQGGRITRGVSKKLLLRLTEEDFSPSEIAEREGMTLINDESILMQWVLETLAEDPRSAADYLGGKSNALRALQGRLMAKSRGRAEPVAAQRLLLEKLSEQEKNEDV